MNLPNFEAVRAFLSRFKPKGKQKPLESADLSELLGAQDESMHGLELEQTAPTSAMPDQAPVVAVDDPGPGSEAGQVMSRKSAPKSQWLATLTQKAGLPGADLSASGVYVPESSDFVDKEYGMEMGLRKGSANPSSGTSASILSRGTSITRIISMQQSASCVLSPSRAKRILRGICLSSPVPWPFQGSMCSRRSTGTRTS
jgi:hypothetical protein